VSSDRDPHLTVVFTVLGEEMQAKSEQIVSDVQKACEAIKAAQGIRLRFKRFEMMNSRLTAVFVPIDAVSGEESQKARAQYESFRQQVQRMVRRAADKVVGRKAWRQADDNEWELGRFPPEQSRGVPGKALYAMDVRPGTPHMTLKASPGPNDMKMLQDDVRANGPPADLELRLPDLIARFTNSVTQNPDSMLNACRS